MFLFRFNNPDMVEDTIDSKTGKVLIHKEINVCAEDEENARLKAYRPKIDTDSNKLSDKWGCVAEFPLNSNWS